MEINLKKEIKPLSQFRTDPASILRQVRENRRPVVITERGNPSAILVDVEEYEKQQAKLELLEAIFEGERDFQEGHFESLDKTYKETRQWLEKK